jgi:hypothetical protein
MRPVAIQAKQNVSASSIQHAPDHFFPWSPLCHHVRVIKSSDLSCGARSCQAFSLTFEMQMERLLFFVCPTCVVSIRRTCSPRYSPSHELIWTRSPIANCPRLRPLWASSVVPFDVSPTTAASQRASRCACSVRGILSRDLDAVMAIEAASFTEPYAREVFDRFVSKSLEPAARCWSIVVVRAGNECFGECDATPSTVSTVSAVPAPSICPSDDVCGYCLSDEFGSSVKAISIGTAAMYRGRGVGSATASPAQCGLRLAARCG